MKINWENVEVTAFIIFMGIFFFPFVLAYMVISWIFRNSPEGCDNGDNDSQGGF